MKPATPPDASALGQTLAWLRSLPRLRLLPLRDALRTADSVSLKADAKAGAAVALVALPMALALSTKAGLPVWCGLAATGVAAIAAPLFSGSPLLSAGPSNTTAAMLLGAFAAAGATLPEARVALLPALLLMTGGFVLLAAWLRLGALADHVPRAVLAAYLAAAAVRVAIFQLPAALGIAIDPAASPVETLWRAATAGRALLNPDLMVAVAALAVFLLVRRTRDTGPAILAAVATSAFLAVLAENVALSQGYAPRQGLFAYVGDGARMPASLPPDFSLRALSLLFSPALALALLIVVESTAGARAAAGGRAVDIHQELLGLGAANLACAACPGLPASGPAGRSGLGIREGARSGLASVATGAVILGLASVAGGAIARIPLAALAILVIAAERELANLPAVRRILGSGPRDRAAFVATFLAALVAPLDIALYLGLAVAVGLHLRDLAGSGRPAGLPDSAASRPEDWRI